jgi:hypothetical protein
MSLHERGEMVVEKVVAAATIYPVADHVSAVCPRLSLAFTETLWLGSSMLTVVMLSAAAASTRETV